MAALSFLHGYWNIIAFAILSGLTLLYLFSLHRYNYWKKKGIPFLSATFPFGTVGSLVLQKWGIVEQFTDLYNRVEGKYAGFYVFLSPQILIKDLNLIKDILVKDFSKFTNRGMYFNENVDPLSAHLFAIEGTQWRKLRNKLSPTFTSGKMKTMYSTLKESSIELQDYVVKNVSKDDVLDFKDITSRYGLDVISSAALGLKGNNFVDDNTEMKRITALLTAPDLVQMTRITFALMCKTIAKSLRLRFVPKEAEDYFVRVVQDNTAYRQNNNIKRNDFMQLLMDMNATDADNGNNSCKKENDVSLTLQEMAAQSFLFVAAGYETTSVTLGFCLYELALNPDIQDRLIAEIDAAGDDISYELLHQLPYMDMVVNEALRKYPPVATLQRESSSDYVLPDGQVVDKGTLFIVSVIGLHRDPKLFPNPDVFDPERFSKENAKKILPYSYLPFGEGPRICIGMRFGKMQVKSALVAILSHFKVEKCGKTPIPLKIEKRTFSYNVEGGVWLRAKRRNKLA